jgi:hypothetical protein
MPNLPVRALCSCAGSAPLERGNPNFRRDEPADFHHGSRVPFVSAMKFRIPRLTAIGLLCWALPVSAELTIPAFTAYTLPNPDAARISEQSGVTRWTDPETTVNWFGQLNATGALNA